MKARDIMTKEVITVSEEENIENATKLLIKNKISGVPVVNEDNKVVGIVTETDLIFKDKDISIPSYVPLLGGFILLDSVKKFENELKKVAAYKVKDLMSTPAIKVEEDDEVRKVVNLMLDKRINRVPVIDEEGKIKGIIARSDILTHL
ncbi:CBS domain-containing protein [Clostridium sp. D2Q-14]|uniref:CBS domain-containing protein n=1 Tax=Anaeromonas gelatinilytica TaxID=2683194 RepID=UPI00193B6A49|nr:CBS domain-containing protein [Anaeromonas gelatinilytica]MBS4534818.1 CBS domain-containing protein [Anaeromonas gelatinilytica]